MVLKFSNHALDKHKQEKWNALTIREAHKQGRLKEVEFLLGDTADILCGKIEGDFVGLILSKETDGMRIIITGFAAPREYWINV